jgi:hypothetical protein
MANEKKWMNKIHPKKNALHHQMGIPAGQPIPDERLHAITNSDSSSPLLKRRAELALRYRGQ